MAPEPIMRRVLYREELVREAPGGLLPFFFICFVFVLGGGLCGPWWPRGDRQNRAVSWGAPAPQTLLLEGCRLQTLRFEPLPPECSSECFQKPNDKAPSKKL